MFFFSQTAHGWCIFRWRCLYFSKAIQVSWKNFCREVVSSKLHLSSFWITWLVVRQTWMYWLGMMIFANLLYSLKPERFPVIVRVYSCGRRVYLCKFWNVRMFFKDFLTIGFFSLILNFLVSSHNIFCAWSGHCLCAVVMWIWWALITWYKIR